VVLGASDTFLQTHALLRAVALLSRFPDSESQAENLHGAELLSILLMFHVKQLLVPITGIAEW